MATVCKSWLIVLIAGAAVGCADVDIDDRSAPIVGGIPTFDYPAALYLYSGAGYCTGSLIAPNVVLTAAHCHMIPDSVAMTMDGDQVVTYHDVVEVVFHRRHEGGYDFTHHDVSLLRLEDEPPVNPLPFRIDPLPDVVGEDLTVVGFGHSDGVAQTGGGRNRIASLTIELMDPDYLRAYKPDTSICHGDSGGPAFLTFDEVETVVGVTRSVTRSDCTGDSQFTRTDAYAAEFIVPYVDAWYGPCRFDETCVTEGCRTPDPDCAPCGIDGVCSTGCAEVNLDCPLGELFGDECQTDDDCESRLCIDNDGLGAGYCSELCDGAGALCPLESVCEDAGGVWQCVIPPPDDPPDDDDGGCRITARGSTRGGFAALVLFLVLIAIARMRR